MSPLLEAILSGVGYVGEALDAPGAYLRGAMSGDLGERRSGREMLEAWGLLGENEEGLDFGDVAGFGADMLVDPLNLLSGGTLGALKGANKGIDAANAVSKANALSNQQSLAMRMAGAMPEENVPLSAVGSQPFYHGTPRRGVEATNMSLDYAGRTTDSGWYGKGLYFADDPQVADDYTTNMRGDTAGSIVKALLDMRNPYRPAGHTRRDLADSIWNDYGVDVTEGLTREYVPAPLLPTGGSAVSELDEVIAGPDFQPGGDFYGWKPAEPVPSLDDFDQTELSSRLTEVLRSRGHDGVMVPPGSGGASDIPEYVVFDPRQVHSPYVAPSLRNVDPLRGRHSLSPVLMALAANNSLQAPYDLSR